MRLLQDVVVPYITAPLWLRREGTASYLREYESTQFWNPERIRALQTERLKTLLQFAYSECDYYREMFRTAGAEPGDIRRLEDLSNLPVLTKDDIRNNFDRLRPRNLVEGSYFVNFTGGSTGSPLKFLVSNERLASRNALAIRHNRWSGWRHGIPIAYLWGCPQDAPAAGWRQKLRTELLDRGFFLDTFDVDNDSAERFVARMMREPDVVVQAYSRSLLWFAQYVEKQGIGRLPIKSIITTAECITAEERGYIERVLGASTFDRYGCREFSVIASQCGESKDAMHIAAEAIHLEYDALIDNAGDLLVTDLLNYAMPMIRYKIGDVGAPADGKCLCGRGLPMMKVIAGRVTDFIHTPDDRWLSGVAINTYLVSQIPGVHQAQIRQDSCDHLRILLVPRESGKEAAEQFLATQIPKMFGSRMRHSLIWVSSIEKEPSGKMRVTISDCALRHPLQQRAALRGQS
jgi:phenylacetate-CoA ligase